MLALLLASAPSRLPRPGAEHHDVMMSLTSPGALWSRSDLRARTLSLIVLRVLVGPTIGLATAAYNGAQRTDSALSRLQSRTNASDAVVTVVAVIVVVPVALIAANLLAIIPARWAPKAKPALVLRSE